MTTKLVYDACVSDLFRCQHCMCLWLSANRAARAQNKIAHFYFSINPVSLDSRVSPAVSAVYDRLIIRVLRKETRLQGLSDSAKDLKDLRSRHAYKTRRDSARLGHLQHLPPTLDKTRLSCSTKQNIGTSKN